MLQMTEMLASLMTRPAMKQEIETKLGSAFKILVKEAYPESGRFFLSKKGGDSAELTYAAFKAIEKFNSHASGDGIKGLKIRALRDYFLTKVSTSTCICKTALLIDGLNMIIGQNAYPFVKVVTGDKLMLGENGSITLQFYDAMGNPVGMDGRQLVSVELYYLDGIQI